MIYDPSDDARKSYAVAIDAMREEHEKNLKKFDPRKTQFNDEKQNAVIQVAQKIKDWPTLRHAVDTKIAEWIEFVRWWEANVTANKGGDRRSKNQINRSVILIEQATKMTGISAMQVSRVRKKLTKADVWRDALYGAAYRKAMAEADNHRAQGTGENEWYTPTEYLDAAHDVLGGFDLDPASSDFAQKSVGAKKYFTKTDDGLSKEWHGSVWLNPPYTQPDIARFVSKMVAERAAGRITAAIMLTHNYTDTAWFHEAAGAADAICFTRGRIKFYDAEGNIAAPTQGQAFSYFGGDVQAFAERFRRFGFLTRPQ